MNEYIKKWKTTISVFITTKRQLSNLTTNPIYTEDEEKEDIRNWANTQIELLEQTKPDKEKMLYDQCDENQKEFINYLERVILKGEL